MHDIAQCLHEVNQHEASLNRTLSYRMRIQLFLFLLLVMSDKKPNLLMDPHKKIVDNIQSCEMFKEALAKTFVQNNNCEDTSSCKKQVFHFNYLNNKKKSPIKQHRLKQTNEKFDDLWDLIKQATYWLKLR